MSVHRYDNVIAEIASYASRKGEVGSEESYRTARLCLMDSIGCALLANSVEACRAYTMPEVYGDFGERGARVPGTTHIMPASSAAFAITTAIRWLDFNDTWLAREWGHPSDNFGALLAVADNTIRDLKWRHGTGFNADLTMRAVLDMAIRAYEIQGVLALDNAFNQVGIDHVLLVKVASAAIAAKIISSSDEEVIASAVSHAWLDATLRAYRHAPNTGDRKSWAAGDAVERAVKVATLAAKGMAGCGSALTAPRYGFQDAWFNGDEVTLGRSFGCYVMDNVLFKVRYPAEFHGQTAIEAAIKLHPQVSHRIDSISKVSIKTQEPAMRIINKEGVLNNPADRDHCLQYMTAVALIKGDITSEDYEDEASKDPRIDALREKMVVEEQREYSIEYLDPDRRSIANSVQVFFDDDTSTDEIEVRYPLGHRNRRNEARPLLFRKFEDNVTHSYGRGAYSERVIYLFNDPDRLDEMQIDQFMGLLHLPNDKVV